MPQTCNFKKGIDWLNLSCKVFRDWSIINIRGGGVIKRYIFAALFEQHLLDCRECSILN